MTLVLRKLHRWIFLISAIPLAVIIFTGLILSFQPILQTAGIKPGSITLARVEGYLANHDREGKARGLSIDHFEKVLTIRGVGPDGSTYIDLKTDDEADDDSWVTEWMSWARPVHEHFVYGIERTTGVPIVLLSSIGMITGMVIGMFMGWPRVHNTIAGWHKMTAWTLLPLLVLSPLTGVFMALRINFGQAADRAPPAPILDAVRMVAAKHDLSGLQSIRARGEQQLAMVSEGNSRFTYVVSRQGLQAASSNWARTFHQGDFFGVWGGVMNVVLSLAFILLLITGPWVWARRRFRRPARARSPRTHPAPAE